MEAATTYVAAAVHFDGEALLINNALSCTDSFDVAVNFWFKSETSSKTFLSSDGTDEANNILYFVDGGKLSFELGTHPFSGGHCEPKTINTYINNVWRHCLMHANTDHEKDEWEAVYYIDDVLDIDSPIVGSGTGPFPFMAAFNGLVTRFGGSGFAAESFIGDVADFRLMLGEQLSTAGTIPVETRRLFIGGNGKPVDPAVATLALGTPTILFSGDATTFATNQGNGGAFTVAAGALTNASTSPSD